ncbi:DUF805 domain-containing protein [Algicella marina]|uniref:DUF805 domain-containing protein n=1 Tax=Algicella marina TaxID=2683284 RepID=A0A6P1T2K9_9RHOB|nr:DUF805 domain-containing protein [Algicella marina]QHQ37164.1 DUF805 domain-containing protein [Algicella marina]
MDFATATKTCLYKWRTFSGRSTRSEYWWFFLASVLFMALAFAIAFVATLLSDFSIGDIFGSASGIIFVLTLALPTLLVWVASLAVTVRRLHDLGFSGWWLLGYLFVTTVLGNVTDGLITNPQIVYQLAIANLAISFAGLVVMMIPGRRGPNAYGEDPRFDDVSVFS